MHSTLNGSTPTEDGRAHLSGLRPQPSQRELLILPADE